MNSTSEKVIDLISAEMHVCKINSEMCDHERKTSKKAMSDLKKISSLIENFYKENDWYEEEE